MINCAENWNCADAVNLVIWINPSKFPPNSIYSEIISIWFQFQQYPGRVQSVNSNQVYSRELDSFGINQWQWPVLQPPVVGRDATMIECHVQVGYLSVFPSVLTEHKGTTKRPLDKDVCHYNQCYSSRQFQDIVVPRKIIGRLCDQSIWTFSC